MPLGDLYDWINDFSGHEFIWYVKRLSGNDTLANRSHQAGPYIPREFLLKIFPEVNNPEKENPDVWFDLFIDSHADHRNIRAVWYNNKFRGGTRNEARLTNFGGSTSALLDPESTGAIAIFSFRLKEGSGVIDCHVWVCSHETEEDVVENKIGPVEPGSWVVWTPDKPGQSSLFNKGKPPRKNCWLDKNQIPESWLVKFPDSAEIIKKSVQISPFGTIDPDKRILKRRECEFQVFRSLEEVIELPLIQKGFNSIDDFIAKAQTILQRRKARSGRSLELHTLEIFIEEGLRKDIDFSHHPESEKGKRPDFLFPSESAYKDDSFPDSKLKMLAVKTTCKDRWRQILNEADRVITKHLLTLQEGVSENQFQEMCEANVQLVVPEPLIRFYPKAIQADLQTLESFMADVRLLNLGLG